MKKYKYIEMMELKFKVKNKPAYGVYSLKTQDILGMIEYYPPWRRFVFSADEGAVFDSVCMDNIADFLKNHAGKE